MSRVARSLAVLVLLVVVDSGCAHKHRSGATIHSSDLVAMALPRSELGARASTLQRGASSGFFTNARRAAVDPDPGDTPVVLTRLGRITGYGLQWKQSDQRAVAALETGRGLLLIDTLVELYRRSDSVKQRMQLSVADLRRFNGKPVKNGGTLLHGATFPVPHIGDAASGITTVFRVQGFRFYFTTVAFRVGRLLASVSEARADGQDVEHDVISIATRLHARIERVLAGTA